MRFALAIVAFIVAAGMVAFGIAQRTVFAPDDQQVSNIQLQSDADFTVIDGSVLNTFAGQQKLDVAGSDMIFASYGRTSDITAWLGSQPYNKIGWDPETRSLTSEVVTGQPVTQAAASDGIGTAPAGSDLWLEETSAEGTLTWTVNVPDDISILLASNGTEVAPDDITITWPITNSTPFAGPLIIGGGVFFLIGLILLVWGFVHMRRTRGPRRKSSKPPKLPRAPRVKVPKAKALEPATTAKGRRAVRRVSVLALLGVTTMVLTGCSTVKVDEFFGEAPSPTPSVSASAEADAEITPVAVTPSQVERIMAEISAVATQADLDRNADLLATRFTGPALQERQANYAARGVDGNIPAPDAIPASPIRLDLPEATASWPRHVLAVVGDNEGTVAPMSVVLIQQTPRAQYLVNYAMRLQADTEFPAVAPPTVGAPVLAADNRLLSVRPDELGADYADVLAQGDKSASYNIFAAQPDSLRTQVGLDYKTAKKASFPSTATIEFSNGAGTGPVVAFASNESGAIVALDIVERETVKPVEAGATITASGAVKALLNKEKTSTGFESTYGYQLLFYVPPSTDDQSKVVLLGFAQNLIAAKEL